MRLFDVYTNKVIVEDALPDQIDLGRFFILDDSNKISLLSYSNFSTNKLIRQELLLDRNKSIQDIFVDINIDVEKSKTDEFIVVPLIRRIKNKLGLNEFEKFLYSNVFHLEEIFRQPHYLLERKIEKVNVSRAKRISSKSYQYLASHTEDWIHKSIISFKPSRILNEELELNFNIYENQLTVILIERCLVYLNSRLKEIQDIKTFLEEYQKLLRNRHDEKGWYRKIERNLRLIGSVYDDEHYRGAEIHGSMLSQTEEVLNQINKRLLLLRDSELFYSVNKRTSQTISLLNTNVLVNHRHYRYAKSIWIELDKVKPEKSEAEKLLFEQHVYNGVVAYATSLFSYVLKEIFGYKLYGNYRSFKCIHPKFPIIELSKESNGNIFFKVGGQSLRIVILANEPSDLKNYDRNNHDDNIYILYFAEKAISNNNRFIHIHPIDPDSTERIGSLIRKYILREYIKNLSREYEFQHMLREYVQYISSEYLSFNVGKFTYKFVLNPKQPISYEDVIIKIQEDVEFKAKRSRIDKKNIIDEAGRLVSSINESAETLKNKFLFCIDCCTELPSHVISELNYIRCPTCSYLLDYSGDDIIFKVDNPQLNDLKESDWGMDQLLFKLSEL